MFKVLGKDAFDKLRIKINSITELSCFKEDEFTIHMELENTYIKLIEFGMRPDNLYDVYDSFDNMDIWDIDDMDEVGLKLIIDIFDTMGEMIMGDLWNDDKLFDSSNMDFLISYLYYEDEDYVNERKMIVNNLFKIIIFLKSIIINEKINAIRNGGDNNVSEN